MAVNRIAYFLAGAALGAAGVAVVKSGKGQELLSGMVQGGYGLTENVLTRVETLKEDIEDYMAEARYNREQKTREEAQAEDTVDAAASAKKGETEQADTEDAVSEDTPKGTA